MTSCIERIGEPPADKKSICFCRECFEVVGTETTYSVNLMAPMYPKQFGTDLAAAEAFAALRRRAVSTSTNEIKRRIRWVHTK